jgi:hypothetical protein
LVGVQPVLTQVPPKRWRSMIATRWPAAAMRCASDGPAWPVPMMMASNWGMRISSARTAGALRLAREMDDSDGTRGIKHNERHQA